MRRILSRILLGIVVFVFIGTIGFTLWLRDRYVVPILTYHHINAHSNKSTRLNTVSPKSFDYQMGFLKRHGFKVISFDDLVEGMKKGYNFSRNTIVIHFDDGYEDNYTQAFPILKKYRLPAMIFLVSNKIGTRGFLTWDQMKEMEHYNVLAGSHTQNHHYLPNLSLQEAKEEIFGSKKTIEQNVGHRIDYFVYPTGGFTQNVENLTEQAGYKAAGTTNRGKCRYNEDLFALKRIHMNDKDDRYNGLILWFKFSGYYNLFRASKDSGEANANICSNLEGKE